MPEVRSFCRICGLLCGTRVTITDGRISQVRGDKQNPVSRGFACIKGVQGADVYYGPGRLLHPLKRQPDGSFAPIPLAQALDEIAARLATLIQEDGPRSCATFRGTPNNMDAASYHMLPAWMAAIGSPSFYSTNTIDQSAKSVVIERMGRWSGGKHSFAESDVWMLVGKNPIVSCWGGFNGITGNPVLTLKEARQRGLNLIVIDPRRTETAQFADVFLQPRPGQDPALAAGLIHILLAEGWYDEAFCRDHVEDLELLRSAVAPFTPAVAAERAGVGEAELREVARRFGTASRGLVVTGTGPDMAARSNLAEHLYEAINVLCGRFLREGEEIRQQRVLAGRPRMRAEAIAPRRSWETGPKSRIRDTGTLAGEMMSGVLADEILTSGEGRVRSLLVVAGNPAGAFPDQVKTVEALSALDLLVTIDPYLSETARLSHYVLPPRLPYERADLPLGFPLPYDGPFAQYAAPVVEPPAASELVEDWQVCFRLAQRLGAQIVYNGVPLDMAQMPRTDDLLDILANRSMVPIDEVREHPGGAFFDLEPQHVLPPRPDHTGRFRLASPDVVAEIAEVWNEAPPATSPFTHRLISRRMREVMNTTFRDLPSTRRRHRFNPAYLHPDDLSAQGLLPGERIELISDHGRIPAIVEADDTVRPGVVSMSHGWGALPHEDTPYEDCGVSTGLLISTDRDVEPINAMPRMSAIPVAIARVS